MTFDQFKTICDLAEKLTDIQFGMITRQEMLDLARNVPWVPAPSEGPAVP